MRCHGRSQVAKMQSPCRGWGKSPTFGHGSIVPCQRTDCYLPQVLKQRTRLLDLGFYLLLGLSFVWLRRYEIRQLGLINPDEAELLAAGKRAAMSLIPYETFTTSTYGPLWPMVLGVIHKLGYPLTMPSGHLFAMLLSYAICATVYLMLKKLTSQTAAASYTFGLALIWASGGAPHDVDFVQMASELLPLVLLSVGVCVVALRPHSVRSHLVALALIGSTPFAKFQFVPISIIAAIFVGIGLNRVWRHRLSAVVMILVSYGSCGALLFMLTVLGGNFSKIFDEALPAVTNYVGSDAPNLIERATRASEFFMKYPYFTALGLLGISLIAKQAQDAPIKVFARSLTLPLLAMLIGIMSTTSGPYIFPHYAYMLLASSVLILAMATYRTPRLTACDEQPATTNSPTFGQRITLLAGVIFLVLGFSFALKKATGLEERTYETTWGQVLSADGGRQAANSNTPSEIEPLCPPGSEVFVWGWAAEMFSYFDWTPSSRFVNNGSQLIPSSRQAQFKDALSEELLTNRPVCIAEAIGPYFFRFTDFSLVLAEQVPSVAEMLSNEYEKKVVTYKSVIGDVPLVLYVRMS